MRRACLCFILVFNLLAGFSVCFAQIAKQGCDYHYFNDRKVSTSQCYEKNNFGKALAYDRLGKIIYEKELRRIGGHSSVYFSYYHSGAVSKAEWRSAPDGGIQWYSSLTNFAEDGTVTGYTEQNYDDHVTLIKRPVMEEPKPSVLKKKEVMTCAVIYSSEFWFINHTQLPVIVHADRRYGNDDFHTIALKPGDSVKGGALILAEQFDEPEKFYQFGAGYRKSKTSKVLRIKPLGAQQITKEVKRYYYEVR